MGGAFRPRPGGGRLGCCPSRRDLLKVIAGAGRERDRAVKNPLGRSCEADLAELLRLYAQPPSG
ncbi:hypothetical protein DFAR_3460058 [Desulfarculales bacterium]